MMKNLKQAFKPWMGFVLFGLLLATIPLLAQYTSLIKSSTIITIGGTLIFAIAALGLNILLGYSGLISLGTAGFMGLSAYLSAYLTVDLSLPFEISLIIAVLIPTILGVQIGRAHV